MRTHEMVLGPTPLKRPRVAFTSSVDMARRCSRLNGGGGAAAVAASEEGTTAPAEEEVGGGGEAVAAASSLIVVRMVLMRWHLISARPLLKGIGKIVMLFDQ